MKVILTQDVARLGRRSEIKEVPDGHALNFLIPRKLAIPATQENLSRHNAMLSKLESNKEANTHTFQETLASLKDTIITHEVTANEQGHLFSGVGPDAISAILKEAGHTVPSSAIKLEQPIKELGVFEITIDDGKQKGSCKLELVKQK